MHLDRKTTMRAKLRYVLACGRWSRLREQAGRLGSPWVTPGPAETPALTDARDYAFATRDALGEALHEQQEREGLPRTRYWWEDIPTGAPTKTCPCHGYVQMLDEFARHIGDMDRNNNWSMHWELNYQRPDINSIPTVPAP